MYKRLTCICVRVELASPAYLGLGIILPINVYALPYTRGSRNPRLLGVQNHLNNYIAYKRLARSRIVVELASPTYLRLRII